MCVFVCVFVIQAQTEIHTGLHTHAVNEQSVPLLQVLTAFLAICTNTLCHNPNQMTRSSPESQRCVSGVANTEQLVLEEVVIWGKVLTCWCD